MIPRAIILSFAVCLSGCSYLFMDKVPEDYKPGQDLKCSEGGLPTLDLIASILTGVAATAIIVEQYRINDCELFGKCTGISLTVGAPMYLAAALYAISSWYGYGWAGDCEVAKKE